MTYESDFDRIWITQEGSGDDTGALWCRDQIAEDDVEYVNVRLLNAQAERIAELEAERDHWRNLVNDLEHNAIYLDSVAFYEGRHNESAARIAALEKFKKLYNVCIWKREKERDRITELEAACEAASRMMRAVAYDGGLDDLLPPESRNEYAKVLRDLVSATKSLKHEDGCWCEASFAMPGTVARHSDECLAMQAAMAKAIGGEG